MKEEEIVNAAQWALEHGMGTLMLQSGELLTEKRLRFVEGVVRRVRAVRRSKEEATDGGESGSSSSSSSLAVALSIGELDAASYLRMVDAGASRYLLRIGEEFFSPSRSPLSFSLSTSSSSSLSFSLPPPPLFSPPPLPPPKKKHPKTPPTRACLPRFTPQSSSGRLASAPSAPRRERACSWGPE